MGDGSVCERKEKAINDVAQIQADLVIQKLNAENMTRHILLSASLTVSLPGAAGVALQSRYLRFKFDGAR